MHPAVKMDARSLGLNIHIKRYIPALPERIQNISSRRQRNCNGTSLAVPWANSSNPLSPLDFARKVSNRAE